MIDSRDTAFPSGVIETPGLTKREYIAVVCLQGVLASNTMGYGTDSHCAKKAVQYADALLKELAVEK